MGNLFARDVAGWPLTNKIYVRLKNYNVTCEKLFIKGYLPRMGGIPAKMSQIKRYPRRTTPEDDSFSRTTIVVANQKFQKLSVLSKLAGDWINDN